MVWFVVNSHINHSICHVNDLIITRVSCWFVGIHESLLGSFISAFFFGFWIRMLTCSLGENLATLFWRCYWRFGWIYNIRFGTVCGNMMMGCWQQYSLRIGGTFWCGRSCFICISPVVGMRTWQLYVRVRTQWLTGWIRACRSGLWPWENAEQRSLAKTSLVQYRLHTTQTVYTVQDL